MKGKLSQLLVSLGILLTSLPFTVFAAEQHVSGQITSLMGSAIDPAIRIDGTEAPTGCDGGTYGWIYFSGTAQEKQWLYSTAMAMSLTSNRVTVYTNSDGAKCRISNIQITSGLNEVE